MAQLFKAWVQLFEDAIANPEAPLPPRPRSPGKPHGSSLGRLFLKLAMAAAASAADPASLSMVSGRAFDPSAVTLSGLEAPLASRRRSSMTGVELAQATAQTGAFSGEPSAEFTVTGLVTMPTTFTAASLAALPATALSAAGTSYTGVSLWTLLSSVGVALSPGIKNDILRDYVVATGSDGYQAVVSLGEIDPSFGNRPAIVAYARNDGPLGAEGFARLVLPDDSKHGRWVSNLVGLRVLRAPQ